METRGIESFILISNIFTISSTFMMLVQTIPSKYWATLSILLRTVIDTLPI
jgi:hypothetical protein